MFCFFSFFLSTGTDGTQALQDLRSEREKRESDATRVAKEVLLRPTPPKFERLVRDVRAFTGSTCPPAKLAELADRLAACMERGTPSTATYYFFFIHRQHHHHHLILVAYYRCLHSLHILVGNSHWSSSLLQHASHLLKSSPS